MKHKFKALFTKYVNNLPINKDHKSFILDSEFINDNPDFYLFYPLLFSEYFEVEEEQVNLLCVAGYFYYQSTIFLDKVIDEKQLNLLFPSMVCQEETIKLLASLYPLSSEFWRIWNKRKTDYKRAIQLEQKISSNPYFEKYCELATLKATFGNCAIDSMYHLSDGNKKSSKIYEVLLQTHDYFSVAYQLNDDILDFVSDYKSKQFNWAIHTFDQSYFKKYAIEDCKKVFYLEGYATDIFKLKTKKLGKFNLVFSSLGYKAKTIPLLLRKEQKELFESTILPTSKIAIQIPLVNFNYYNGGTRIIPKTHTKRLSEEDILRLENKIKNDKSFTPKIKTKSCLVRDVKTLHSAGINKSDTRRAMLVLVYAKEWLTPLQTVSKDLYFNIDKNKRHVVKV